MSGRGTGFCSINGNRYFKLLVIEDKRGQDTKNPVVKCLCDCGRKVTRVKHQVKGLHAKSCGICTNAKVDMTGNKSGSLTVIKNGLERILICQCFCGQIVNVPRDRLNRVRNCGTRHSNAGYGIVIDGVTMTLTNWGSLAGISREYSRQLHNKGKLASRVKSVAGEWRK